MPLRPRTRICSFRRGLALLAGLFTIGGAFVINAFVTGYATGGTNSYAIRIPVLAGLLVLNAGLYFASFTVLTAKAIGPRGLLPGAIAGAVAFTALITVGTGLITHQLKNTSATYGAFGAVIGIVAFLLLLAKLSLYAAELNPVLARGLYPRALPLGGEPTDADRRVLTDLVHARTAPRRPGDRRRLRRPRRRPGRLRRRPACPRPPPGRSGTAAKKPASAGPQAHHRPPD